MLLFPLEPHLILLGASLLIVVMLVMILRLTFWRPKLSQDLWVIGSKAYDLRQFAPNHPGGSYILEAGQGRDCTALFHSYHAMSSKPVTEMLKKYLKRDALPAECVDSKLWSWEHTPFYDDLKVQVRAVFGQDRSLYKASWAHLAHYSFLLVLWMVSIKSWLLGSIEAGAIAGLGIWLVSGDILHSATHYAVFVNANANVLLGWAVGWLHHVPSMWVRQHVLAHHLYTNIQNLDPDLDHFRQFAKLRSGWRLSELQNHRPAYCNWKTLFVPITAITGIGPLIGESLQALITGSYMRNTKLQFVKHETCLTVLQLGMVLVLGLALPYCLNRSLIHMITPFAVHGILYYVFSAVSHTNEASTSQVLCTGEAASTGAPASKEWAAHQILTSQGDYATESLGWGFLSLGLNNQAVHHCFPGVHPCHYHKLAPIVKRVCLKHNVKYHAHKTVSDALWSHLGFLGKLNNLSNNPNICA